MSGGACAYLASDGSSGGPASDGQGNEAPFADFRIGDRWVSTSTGGSAGSQGDPITLTWGIVGDGTSIRGSTEGTSPSDLVSMLNTLYGAGPGGIESAPWFTFFEQSFDRWSELSGVTYVYEPNDGGAPITNFTNSQRGVSGQYADVRIGGHSVDGSSGANTLAYNYFPDHADMVIDTDNASFYGNRFNNSVRLRNVLMHEAGHGLGFSHLVSNNGAFLMEPAINASFDGPQLDDILAVQRNYGDALEKNGGNNSTTTATPIGAFGDGDTWVIGADADSRRVESFETDFVSIDGRTDLDFFAFTVTEPSLVDVVLNQAGASYNEGAQPPAGQPSNQSLLDTRVLSDLDLLLFANDGSGFTTLGSSIGITPHTTEELLGVALQPGVDYVALVRAGRRSADNVQLYRLDLSFVGNAPPIPEPATALLLLASPGLSGRRRRVA